MNAVLFAPYILLLFWALKIGFAGILRLTSPELGLTKDYTRQPSVVVIVSSFNEGSAIYSTLAAAGASNYPADKLKILAFDDCSVDGTWQHMQRAASPCVIVSRNPVNKGKARTVTDAIMHSESDVIVTIDSDTILHPDAIREMCACFSDPRVGLVGGVVRLSNPDQSALTAFQSFIYAFVFDLLKLPEAYCRQVAIISGCMSAIRRDVFMTIKPEIDARRFLGIPVRYGEDRWISYMTLRHGFQTFFAPRAICWTTAPENYRSYFSQQLRWARGGVGGFIHVLIHLRSNLRIGPVALLTYLVGPMSVFVLLGSVVLTPVMGDPVNTLLNHFLYFMMALFLMILFVKFFGAEDLSTMNPLRMILWGGWGLIRTMLLFLTAGWTLDTVEWGGARNDVTEERK